MHNQYKTTTVYERDYLNWYNRKFNNPGRRFDPALLVRLARAQWSDRPELAAAFANCTREWPRNGLYTYFQSPVDREKKWDFGGSLFLEHPVLGTLVVDVMKDNSIGGMEYLDRVMGHPTSAAGLQEAMLRLWMKVDAERNVN
ncbi:MAG: hypothetical protein ABI432_17495 [Flavobacteriales bacterium]